MNIKHILQGINNSIFVKEEVEKIAAERYAICNTCPFNSKNSTETHIRPDEHCIKCGCNLHLKTRSLDTQCPVDKWLQIATEEEAEQIENSIKAKPTDEGQ